ncbi:MAG: hypothetical protein DRG78_20715 [Epsilonproteobacteria bacterium]|nr:MAG: hypothetical protein DRG78_20715 [Campylobacterota bacterium]
MVKKDFENHLKDFIRDIAFDLHREIILNTPIDTGRLRNSINIIKKNDYEWEIGTNLEYALYVELGTGIFGKYKRPITPKRAKVLHWIDRDTKKDVFAKKVRGQEGQFFFQKALNKAEEIIAKNKRKYI